MSRVFLATDLEGVATFWRVYRRDGVTLGFVTHDRDLWFGGLLHKAAPGMLPSSIRRSIDLADDPADVEGVLSHDTISTNDLNAGRYDAARVLIGAVDWETLEHTVLYAGYLSAVTQDANGFAAQLQSVKAKLDIDPIPRTSPTCRAQFCGPGCSLSVTRFTSERLISAVDQDANAVQIDGISADDHLFGELRWLDGTSAGMRAQIRAIEDDWLIIDGALPSEISIGAPVSVREGCDHRVETCAARFDNAINFQGEPFLPGNDLLAQYPSAR